jgi:hypothetical protein
MKPLLLLTAVAAVASAQANPDATGWSAATWGMTAQQVQAAFPAARAVNPPEKDTGLFIRLASSPVQLGTFPAKAEFEFPPDRDYLSAVQVSVDASRNRPDAFESLKSSLTEKYGRPTSSDSVTDYNTFGNAIVTKSVIWRVKSSMITLTWIEATSVGMVLVRYAERKPDPTL